MSLIMRVDVDKPYGRSSLPRKVLSKLREDYYFPRLKALRYLDQTKKFAALLAKENIAAIFYFRNCTAPDPQTAQELISQGHLIGFHAENTKSFETFQEELNSFKTKIQPIHVHSFTKHGSGELKLGRHHYPPYEEEKYRQWAKQIALPFPFGNGILSVANSQPATDFFKNMFWLEEEYRDVKAMPVSWATTYAKTNDVSILMHPENYFALLQVRNDLELLISSAKKASIAWKRIQ